MKDCAPREEWELQIRRVRTKQKSDGSTEQRRRTKELKEEPGIGVDGWYGGG